MPTFDVSTGAMARRKTGDRPIAADLSNCVALAIHRQVDDAVEIYRWRVNGGWFDQRSQAHLAAKAFLTPRCPKTVGFGHNHLSPRILQNVIESVEFQAPLENAEVLPAPGASPTNATVAMLRDCHAVTVAANGAVAST